MLFSMIERDTIACGSKVWTEAGIGADWFPLGGLKMVSSLLVIGPVSAVAVAFASAAFLSAAWAGSASAIAQSGETPASSQRRVEILFMRTPLRKDESHPRAATGRGS